MWKLGPVEVIKLVQFEAIHPIGYVFNVSEQSPQTVQAAVNQLDSRYGTSDSVVMSYHSFVIRSAQRIIVVDTCWGDRVLPFEHGPAAELPAQLALLGIALGDVDVVVCTHVHPDHAGWNTRKIDGEWTPTFPNARHLVTADEHRFLVADPRNDPFRLKRVVVEPLVSAGLLDLVADDHVIDEHVRLIALPGHTPGHVGVMISAGDQQIVIAGDAIMSPLQIIEPTLNAVSEADEMTAVSTRHQLLERLTVNDIRLFGSHFPHPTSGTIGAHAGGFRWLPDPD